MNVLADVVAEGALSNLILDNDAPSDATVAASNRRAFCPQSTAQQPGPLGRLKNVRTVEELERNLRQMQQFPQPNLHKPPLLPFFQVSRAIRPCDRRAVCLTCAACV